MRVYFDASCPMCQAEINALRQSPAAAAVQWIDCSSATFQCEMAAQDGIDPAAMMAALHLRDEEGQWLVGVDAFARLYARLGLHGLSNPWALPVLAPWLRRLYPWIARHRQTLSALGLHRLFAWWVARAARRAHARRCSAGQCDLG